MHADSHPDIDPGWYPGQLETAPSDHVPTVLTKLQKWGDYCGVGEPVRPTRFIPMKTPLSKQILSQWSLPQQPKYSLTIPELLEVQQSSGRSIGLILDLSNHECLYTPDMPPQLQYRHINLVAKELPPLDYVRRVAAAADQFWRENPDSYIAIHCAYGFNRTGFVVCSYLVEHCGLSVQQALDAFADARPPGVKHEKFRDELHRRYHDWPAARGQSAAAAVPSLSPMPCRPPSSMRLATGASTAEDDNSSIGNTPDLDDVNSVSPLPPSRSQSSGLLSPVGPVAASVTSPPPALASTEARLSNLRFSRADAAGSVPDNESLGYSEREILAALTSSSHLLDGSEQGHMAQLGELLRGRLHHRDEHPLSSIQWDTLQLQTQQQEGQQQERQQQRQQQAVAGKESQPSAALEVTCMARQQVQGTKE